MKAQAQTVQEVRPAVSHSRIVVSTPAKGGNSLERPVNTGFSIALKVGQVWCDGSRAPGERCIVVENVYDTHVRCRTLRTGCRTRIRKDRMTPGTRGYYYVGDLNVLTKVSRQLTEYHIRQAAQLRPVTVAQPAASKAHVSISNGGGPTI
jgi:hypothetical protein